jgi:multiple sugar transport system permease protein
MRSESRTVQQRGISPVVKGRGRFSLSLQAREALWFHVFTLPWMLGFLIFTLLPMVASFVLSFTRYNVLQPARFVGFKNFVLLFRDPIFWKSLRVTFVYTGIAVPLSMVISLFLAMLLNLRVPGMRAIRTIYYLPSILPAVVTGLVWVWLFSVDFGLLNYLIYLIAGVKGPNWLGSERWVMQAMIISGLWGVGGGVLILLATLQNIPNELYEAAELDGAGVLQRFWHVTVPMISSVILYNLIVGIIGSLQTFARIYVLTGGGPNYASYFYNLYIYDNAFSFLKFGLASAQAWILFVVILILTYLALRTSGRWVYYAGGR